MRITMAGCAAGIAFIGAALFCAACIKENSSPSTPMIEVTPSAAPSPTQSPSRSPSQRPATNLSPEQRKNAFQKPTLPPPRSGEQGKVIRLSPSPSPVSSPSPGPSRTLTNEAGLFAYYPQQRLMPEDFKIGPLQDGVSATRDYIRAIGTIRAFLDGLAKKKIDDALVIPAVRAEIKSVISYPLSQGYVPERYRIGKISFERDDEIRAGLRLYRGEGITTGEIYVKKIEDAWLVKDLQAGFTLLAKKYEKSKEPFVPGSYRFLLKDH